MRGTIEIGVEFGELALEELGDGIDALLAEAVLLGESEVMQGASGEIGSRAWM